jgi:hypothetical protein
MAPFQDRHCWFFFLRFNELFRPVEAGKKRYVLIAFKFVSGTFIKAAPLKKIHYKKHFALFSKAVRRHHGKDRCAIVLYTIQLNTIFVL